MVKIMNLLQQVLLLLSPLPFTRCDQRPFYVIGHMVNNVSLIKPFLDMGSNVLEFDVHFSPNGSVKELHHGFPCDLGRRCSDKADLAVFLDKVRELTDPGAKNGYYKQLVMLLFDMKLESSRNKTKSAVDILEHLLAHLWTKDKSRKQEVRVLLYIEKENNSDFILSFTKELKRRQLDLHLSKNIGFDGGTGDVDKIRQMFSNLNVTSNVWGGDGITNFFRPFRDDRRLKRLLSVRDSGSSGFVHKVYDWTVDKKFLMRGSLRLGVDGMITNLPRTMVDVLKETEFKKSFRLANVEDDCFKRFVGKTA